MGNHLCIHEKDYLDKYDESKKPVNALSCSNQSEKLSRLSISHLKSSVDHRLKYQRAIPFPCHGSRLKQYHSRYWGLEPMENLEKFFILCACTVNTEMTPICDLSAIISELNTCGILDSANYLEWMNENNETPLEIAIRAGNTVMVRLLLEYGNEDFYAEAFLVACVMGKKKIVKLLLDANAHSNLAVHVKTDCVIICTKHGYNQLLNMLSQAGFLLSNADRSVELKAPLGSVVPLLWKTWTNGSLLHIGAGNGHHQIMDFLITHDADIDLIDSCGRKPIHLAVQGGIHCIRILLRACVNIEAVDSKGRTALFLAASFGNIREVKFLLHNGADFDSANYQGVSVLLAAALSNQDRCVKYLLDKGAALRGVCPKQLNYLNLVSTGLPKFIGNKTTYRTEEQMNWAILNKLEKNGNALTYARISLHIGIDPEIILSYALRKGNRRVIKLLMELDNEENAAMMALNYSILRAQKYIILSYVYPKRLTSSFFLKALQ